jgi:hypothetical protein
LAEKQVETPAAEDVPARLAAMVQDGAVGATGLFQGVGQGGGVRPAPPDVYLLGQLPHGTATSGEPGRVEDNRAERVAEEVAEQVTLGTPLVVEVVTLPRTTPPLAATITTFISGIRFPTACARARNVLLTTHSSFTIDRRLAGQPHSSGQVVSTATRAAANSSTLAAPSA